MFNRFNVALGLIFCNLHAGITAVKEREEGQALVEYGLILALVSVVAVIALALIGTNVTAKLNTVAGKLV
jgi:Flp pilus assembly pilin Flp